MKNPVSYSRSLPSTEHENQPLLELRDLKVYFPVTKGVIVKKKVGDIKAVDGVDAFIYRGETLGLVGESGSGKSTIGRTIVRLERPSSGKVLFQGTDLGTLKGSELQRMRRGLGIVFQDPYGSLNPRMNAGSIVGEPLRIHHLFPNRIEYRAKVKELFETVGLHPGMMDRFPHEFSGGQRQRLAVARALSCEPSLIVLDEAVSALDVSVQAQVLNLLKSVQQRLKVAYLFISHDLAVVRHVADRIAVMYLGRIVETATKEQLFSNPSHPYTKALLSAVPIADPARDRQRQRTILVGDIPSPMNPPSGCVFRTRCPLATEECAVNVPEFKAITDGHFAACIKIGA